MFLLRVVAGSPPPSVRWARADSRPLPPFSVLGGGVLRIDNITAGDSVSE